jgi:hypothetical protein
MQPSINLAAPGFNLQVGMRLTNWVTAGFDYTLAMGQNMVEPGMLLPSVQNGLRALLGELAAMGLVPPGYQLAVPFKCEASSLPDRSGFSVPPFSGCDVLRPAQFRRSGGGRDSPASRRYRRAGHKPCHHDGKENGLNLLLWIRRRVGIQRTKPFRPSIPGGLRPRSFLQRSAKGGQYDPFLGRAGLPVGEEYGRALITDAGSNRAGEKRARNTIVLAASFRGRLET